MSDSVEDILNTPETVEAFGRKYVIGRFSVGQLLRTAEHIAPLGYLIRTAIQAGKSQENIGDLIAQILMTGGPPAIGLLSVATEEPIEWLEHPDRDPIEAFELLSVAVEKNVRYFFAPKNKARLEAAFARIKTAVQTESGKFATSSPPVDTAH